MKAENIVKTEKINSGTIFKCPLCVIKRIFEPEEFASHLYQHFKGLGPGKCVLCQKEVKSLHDHFVISHLNGSFKSAKERCQICLKRVPDLGRHLKNLTRDCKVCHVKVAKKTCLDRHFVKFHKCFGCDEFKNDQNSYFCLKCSKTLMPKLSVEKILIQEKTVKENPKKIPEEVKDKPKNEEKVEKSTKNEPFKVAMKFNKKRKASEKFENPSKKAKINQENGDSLISLDDEDFDLFEDFNKSMENTKLPKTVENQGNNYTIKSELCDDDEEFHGFEPIETIENQKLTPESELVQKSKHAAILSKLMKAKNIEIFKTSEPVSVATKKAKMGPKSKRNRSDSAKENEPVTDKKPELSNPKVRAKSEQFHKKPFKDEIPSPKYSPISKHNPGNFDKTQNSTPRFAPKVKKGVELPKRPRNGPLDSTPKLAPRSKEIEKEPKSTPKFAPKVKEGVELPKRALNGPLNSTPKLAPKSQKLEKAPNSITKTAPIPKEAEESQNSTPTLALNSIKIENVSDSTPKAAAPNSKKSPILTLNQFPKSEQIAKKLAKNPYATTKVGPKSKEAPTEPEKDFIPKLTPKSAQNSPNFTPRQAPKSKQNTDKLEKPPNLTPKSKPKEKSAPQSENSPKTKDVFWNKCGKCDFKTQKDSDLNKHIIAKHICPLCSKMKSDKDLCENCHQSFDMKVSLAKLEFCPFCDQVQENLKVHMEQNDLQPRKCGKCPFESTNYTCLKNHQIRVHEVTKSFIFCNICDISFSKPSNLEKHANISH